MPLRELRPNEEFTPTGTLRDLGPDEEVIPDHSPIQQFARSANVGIAEMGGALVDLTNAALGLVGLESEEPFGGSVSIQRGFAALGIAPQPGEKDPNTFASSAGRITGAASLFLLPLAGPARAVAAGKKATGVVSGLGQDIARTAIKAPKKFLATEVTAASAAGIGGKLAADRFPDSPSARVIGELTGALTPAGVVAAVRAIPTIIGARAVRALVKPFTAKGARGRAEKRVKESARELELVPGKAAEEVLPEAGLTPAQLAEDEGLLSLERAVIESTEQLKGQADEQIAAATQVIRDAIKGLGEGVPVERTAETIKEARSYISALLDTRMRQAALIADEKIAALGPQATREEANLIARDELEKALASARAQEAELWATIPEEITVSTAGSRGAFESLVATTPKAQSEDIPAIARKFLDPESNSKFTDKEPVAELQGLRTKLLEEARISRSAGERNKARLADDLAEAVLADMGATRGAVEGEAGEAYRVALDFSNEVMGKFRTESVARVLGTTRRGGAKVPAELTLETTIGKGGPKARIEERALLDAAPDPALKGAIEDFLLDEFQRKATRAGRINAAGASRFMERNKEILDDFPDLRARIEDAIDADNVALATKERAEGIAKRLGDPKVSRAAVFLKEPLEKAMERIVKSPNPEEIMAELVKQAGRDTTGDALKGLKTAFGDFLVQKAGLSKVTLKDQRIISGRKLKELLNKGPTSKMAKELLTKEELKRLKIVATTAEKLEKAVQAVAKTGGVVSDPPSLLFTTIARIAGAQVGRKVAKATGGGTVQTPGIMSNLFKKALTKGTQDPARRLIVDAMSDEKLFKALLSSPEEAIKSKAIQQKLNAWLASVTQEAVTEKKQKKSSVVDTLKKAIE